MTNSVTDNFNLHLIGDGFKLCKITKKIFGEKCAGVKKKLSPKIKKRVGVRRKKLSPHFEKRAGVKKKLSPKFKKRAGVGRKKLSPHFEKRAGVKKKLSPKFVKCV